MNAFAYARYELLRTFRNKRLFIFSFGFPLVLYYAIAGPSRNVHNLTTPVSPRRCTTWSASSPSGR